MRWQAGRTGERKTRRPSAGGGDGARARGGHLPSLGLWFFIRGEGAYLVCRDLSFLWVSLGFFWGLRFARWRWRVGGGRPSEGLQAGYGHAIATSTVCLRLVRAAKKKKKRSIDLIPDNGLERFPFPVSSQLLAVCVLSPFLTTIFCRKCRPVSVSQADSGERNQSPP